MRELALNVMDIAQNSIAAEASLIEIAVCEDNKEKTLSISINDNGKGMTEDQVKSVVDPFYTTRKTRSVGLGIPLFKMAAEMTGGNFKIDSKKGVGTKVIATFKTDNIDMTPLGDINSTISLLIRCNPDRDFIYKRVYNGRTFDLDTRKLREILEDVPLDSTEVMTFIDEYLKENTQDIFGGAE